MKRTSLRFGKRSLFTALWKKKSFLPLGNNCIDIGCGPVVFGSKDKRRPPVPPDSARLCRNKRENNLSFLSRKPCAGLFVLLKCILFVVTRESIQSSKLFMKSTRFVCIVAHAKKEKKTFLFRRETVSHKAGFQNFDCHRKTPSGRWFLSEQSEIPKSRRARDTSDWRFPDSSNNWDCYHEDTDYVNPHNRPKEGVWLYTNIKQAKYSKIQPVDQDIEHRSVRHSTTSIRGTTSCVQPPT